MPIVTMLRLSLLLLGLAGCQASADPAPGPPPIIMISLDTFRADRIAAFGGARGRTPNLDKLAAESVVFTHAYAQASETLFSHASLFTGRYPSELNRVDYHFSLPTNPPTMAEVLGLYGYRTFGSVAGGHLSEVFGLGKGFQEYTTPKEWGSLWHTVPPALEWIKGVDTEPFFLFIHGYDTHARYLKPDPVGHLYTDREYSGVASKAVRDIMGTGQVVDGVWHTKRRFDKLFRLDFLRPHTAQARSLIQPNERAQPMTKADLEHIRQIYDGAATYADLQVGLLMAGLETAGILDRAWVIVLSDHGEELGEYGIFEHRLHLGEELLHVPLIMRPPGGLKNLEMKNGRRVNRLTGLIDLMPTVLELAGATPPAGLHGTSLVPILRGEHTPAPAAVFSEAPFRMVSAATTQGGLIFSGLSAHSPHLSEMLDSTPLSSPAFETWGTVDQAALKTQLQQWRASLTATGGAPDVDMKARQKVLQQRGYWGNP